MVLVILGDLFIGKVCLCTYGYKLFSQAALWKSNAFLLFEVPVPTWELVPVSVSDPVLFCTVFQP